MSRTPNQSVRPVTFSLTPDNTTAVIGGVSAAQLAQQFGTPLYVLDETTLRHMIGAYQTAFSSYPAEVNILYASKANLSLGLCALLAQENVGLDAVSGGELYTAWKSGFPMDRVLFNGNNKSVDELRMALEWGVGKISVDNLQELEHLYALGKEMGKTVSILLRVTPGIECHTHDYIKTGHLDSKFGFDLSQLPDLLTKLTGPWREVIDLCGLHAHIGSQIFETRPYADLVDVMMTLFNDIRTQYGVTLTHLNLGGGLGITYQDNVDDPPSVNTYAQTLIQTLIEKAQALAYPLPAIFLEPGRSLVATAGVTLYTVGTMKTIPELNKTYVAVDGGMGDNIRPALYGAVYSAMVANRASDPTEKTVTVAGKYCESGDILLQSFQAPANLSPGDLLMVFDTGAYNYAMSSNYNRVPRPATVLVKDGQAAVLVARETYEDLVGRDRIPASCEWSTQPV